ncbi:MAG TPA: ABC transporter substrate-binding protein [Candidatus Merdenecus merdavium]|nr:ABC transporter substrate-binding protein [Candidatus Merdenecus merdavium]
MKKFISLVLSISCAAMLLTGCGNEGKDQTDNKKSMTASDSTESESSSPDSTNSKGNAKEANSDDNYKIGIIQFVQHEALDEANRGFVDGLAEAGYIDGENITINQQNASGDQSNAPSIANTFVNDDVDLILAIATPAAQAVANATQEIPILVTAVTDPAEAGLVESNEAPGGNITGTSDLSPVKEQIDLLKEFVPDAQKIAILYCTNEINSKLQADIAKEAAKELGMEAQDYTVSNSNEIQQVTESLVGKVDAIYAPTDNIISAGMQTVTQVSTPNKIPVICGEEGMLPRGALATKGINYYNLGKQTAAQAVKILNGTSEPANMPVEYIEDVEFKYNEEVLADLEMELPAGLK